MIKRLLLVFLSVIFMASFVACSYFDNTPEEKTLVVYFSCSGNTESIAELIAERTNADIAVIEPEDAYEAEDLTYDKKCRSYKEQHDKSVRPEIKAIDNIDDYHVIYIGFPIWWGEEPRVIDTFIESYDFSGKHVIPFCTSESSGIDNAERNLRELADAEWVSGKRIPSDASYESIIDWIDDMEKNRF